MLLIGDSNAGVDVYYYKLILATLCSKYGHSTEFEELAGTGYLARRDEFRNSLGRQEKSFVEVFKYYLRVTRRLPDADQIINESYVKLFSTNASDIRAELFASVHMDKKLYHMLNRALNGRLIPADWQHLKSDLLECMNENIKMSPNFIGEYASLFAMINSTIMFYVRRKNADLHRFINKTGMNLVDDDEFSFSMLNIEVLSSGVPYNINFPELLKSIQKLNSILFTHRLDNVDTIYFYDVLSYYKYPHLDRQAERVAKIMQNVFKGKGRRFVYVDENKQIKKPGISEKFQKFTALLEILEPIVKSGLQPSEVDRYVEKIYHHVIGTNRSTSSNLITVVELPNQIGNYGTTTAFSKMEGHEVIKNVLEGVMAVHHLFMYLSSKNLNLFDLESEIFMYEKYLYRFEKVEEAIDLFYDIKLLMERAENEAMIAKYEENRLPLNDSIVGEVGFVNKLQSSIAFVDISQTMGDLTAFGTGRKQQRGKKKINPIYSKFYKTYDSFVTAEKAVMRVFTSKLTFGSVTIDIDTLKFMHNLLEKRDIVSALQIKVFEQKNIKAEVPLDKDDNSGYWNLPKQEFSYYCMNNSGIIKYLKILHAQPESVKDAILEVYRCACFMCTLFDMMKKVQEELDTISHRFRAITKVPMGFFDAYSFASRFKLISSLRTMSDEQATQELIEYLRPELFITNQITEKEICQQLVRVYKLFKLLYKQPLEHLEEIQDLYYTGFADRLGGGYTLSGDESFFEEARRVISLEKFRNPSEGFTRYASGCTRTVWGFLKKRGKLVTKTVDGQVLFLSDRGIWVGKRQNGGFITISVQESDFGR